MVDSPDWLSSGWPHIWLPYAQMQTAPLPLPVVGAEGCRIRLADGRELIDGVASWWSVCHGYRHPHIMEALSRQLETLPHVMLGGFAHEQAYRLAARLSAIAPPGLSRVFFSDSGSTAVEVALKMALQYWQNKGKPKKDRFVCFTDGYHGDTFAAMSVSDPAKSMHKAFRHAVIPQFVVDIPQGEYALAECEAVIAGMHKQIAAMIIEPLVQGAGGMKFHDADVLAALYRMARAHDILFIADEIATGFGRTGSMFACNEAGISPDIMCLGKALTGGTLGLGATLASQEVFSAFLSDDPDAAFMHGPTFMGNALACAAANASLDIFEREPRLQQVEAIEAQLFAELEPCRALQHVLDVRVKGAIGVVQLDLSEEEVLALRARFVEQGVWIRPFGNIVYITPPLTITAEELLRLTGAMVKVISDL